MVIYFYLLISKSLIVTNRGNKNVIGGIVIYKIILYQKDVWHKGSTHLRAITITHCTYFR